MFNGVPEQFHQFIASRTTTPLPLSHPLTLPLHVSPSPPPPTFSNFIDPQQLSHQHLQQHQHHQLYQQQSHLLHQLHQQQQQQSASTVQQVMVHHHHQQRQDEGKEDEEEQLRERVRSVSEMGDPWEKEEVLALLRIRSSMGHGFSDFIWGHVSRYTLIHFLQLTIQSNFSNLFSCSTRTYQIEFIVIKLIKYNYRDSL